MTAEGYFEGVTASDYITLPEYKGISISSEVLTAREDDLNSQIDSILSNYVTYEEIKDRAAADGDTLNIDYIGKVDGEEFEGGSTDGDVYKRQALYPPCTRLTRQKSAKVRGLFSFIPLTPPTPPGS